ncbi:hypothetical protein Salat_1122800 [Sesamum alatum]|uniref:Uncharacterized protein n=1 Tax=Sesamum alatum TaxID=300844 RepID=A0AAE1YDW2_9LAMI|nr:hypothetical protein Salat_1122800 [Sesamum alatum]
MRSATEFEAGNSLVVSGASASEQNIELEAGVQVPEVVKVLGFHGLAGGEVLVCVVGNIKVGLSLVFEKVGSILLIIIWRAGAVDGNDDESVGGEVVSVRLPRKQKEEEEEEEKQKCHGD